MSENYLGNVAKNLTNKNSLNQNNKLNNKLTESTKISLLSLNKTKASSLTDYNNGNKKEENIINFDEKTTKQKSRFN